MISYYLNFFLLIQLFSFRKKIDFFINVELFFVMIDLFLNCKIAIFSHFLNFKFFDKKLKIRPGKFVK